MREIFEWPTQSPVQFDALNLLTIHQAILLEVHCAAYSYRGIISYPRSCRSPLTEMLRPKTPFSWSRGDALTGESLPRSCHFCHLGARFWPVMKNGRVEIGSAGPDKSLNFWIQLYLIKNLRVTKWPIQFARQYGAEVNGLFAAVSKSDLEGKGRHFFESSYFVDFVAHRNYLRGSEASPSFGQIFVPFRGLSLPHQKIATGLRSSSFSRRGIQPRRGGTS